MLQVLAAVGKSSLAENTLEVNYVCLLGRAMFVDKSASHAQLICILRSDYNAEMKWAHLNTSCKCKRLIGGATDHMLTPGGNCAKRTSQNGHFKQINCDAFLAELKAAACLWFIHEITNHKFCFYPNCCVLGAGESGKSTIVKQMK